MKTVIIKAVTIVFAVGVLGYIAISTPQVRDANAEGTISAPKPVNKPGRAPTKAEQEAANDNSSSNSGSNAGSADTGGMMGGCCS